MNSSETFIEKRLNERRLTGTYRKLRPENTLIDFSSNDYLGFAHSEKLKNLIHAEVESKVHVLNGSTGSRLLTGNLSYCEELENQIAAYHQSEAGLIFNSGYDANIGLFSSLPQRGDTIIHDELIHASIIDGARLSHANRYSFKHNDLASLEEKLNNAKGNCYIAIESVYSMDGDMAPIKEIIELAENYNAQLVVDEAHAVGLYKMGLINQLGFENRVFARIVTFGKALGCHGAIVLGSKLLREYLINFSRPFIYTTAASFHQLAAIKMAYQLLSKADKEVGLLHDNIRHFKNTSIASQHIIQSDSAIQCVLLNSNEKTKQAAERLQNHGLDVRAILSPTVPLGSERLRICLHSYNSANEIALLTNQLNELINE